MKYKEAIRKALRDSLKADSRVFVYGLGVPDKTGVFGTTHMLRDEFPNRVFDMPTSENAMLGIGIGASIGGMIPVMTHQRLDFFLLALDQLINNAAKWNFMFNRKKPLPIVIRLIIGRGWGQGPTHSQSLQSWFAHIPGLTVVMPTFPADVYGLLMEALKGDGPVLILEHRWLYELEGELDHPVAIGKARMVSRGDQMTIVGLSFMVIEAMRANLDVDLIDLISIRPIDWGAIFRSVKKTGKLLVLDPAHPTCSVASEIIAQVALEGIPMTCPPRRLCFPEHPCPTSYEQSKNFYTTTNDIVMAYREMTGIKAPLIAERIPHDVPGNYFNGPF